MKEVKIMENYDELLEITKQIQTMFFAYTTDVQTMAMLAGNTSTDKRPEQILDKIIKLRDKLQTLTDKQDKEIISMIESVI
jgi:hypothetical protein